MDTAAVMESVVLSLICVISLTGNLSLFLIVFYGNKNLRTVSNAFMLNLAFADVIVSIINMPITVATTIAEKQWFSHGVCVVLGFTNIISFIGSVMSLALMAINRYFYIVHWKKYTAIFNKKRACVSVLILWLITVLIAMPPLIGWSSYSFIPGKSYCFVDWQADAYYMYFMLSICFFGPLVTMIFCYSKILKFTGKVKRRIINAEHGVTHAFGQGDKRHDWLFKSRLSPEEVKLTNTLLIVVSAFLICWTPFAITMFFDVYSSKPLPRAIDMGSLLLGYLNSMCNPIIYAARNRQFKNGFIDLFSHCFPCFKKHRETTIIHINITSSNTEGNSGAAKK